MTDQLEADLRRAEKRLQAAMLAGDVDELDALLHERLIATLTPARDLIDKQQDLHAHRVRELVLTDLVEDGLDLATAGRTGVTRAILSLRGSNAGVPFATTMLYTRTWTHDDEHGWRVLAAHITPLS